MLDHFGSGRLPLEEASLRHRGEVGAPVDAHELAVVPGVLAVFVDDVAFNTGEVVVGAADVEVVGNGEHCHNRALVQAVVAFVVCFFGAGGGFEVAVANQVAFGHFPFQALDDEPVAVTDVGPRTGVDRRVDHAGAHVPSVVGIEVGLLPVGIDDAVNVGVAVRAAGTDRRGRRDEGSQGQKTPRGTHVVSLSEGKSVPSVHVGERRKTKETERKEG